MTTNELLRRYVAGQSEAAFAELVRQHIALVYSAALRQVNGDVPAAQDVTQAVFTDLARKAPGLIRHTSLTGWLYTSTRFLASKARRAEQSRRSREQEAHDMNQLLHSTDPDTIWQDLRPMLDDAMHDLSPADREAVLLRYFERLPLAEIGARLGLTDKAVHMRVERAIDRLRAALARRGITSTITALAVVLSTRAMVTVPAGLAAQVSQSALATVATGGALGWGLLKLAGLLKAQALLAAGMAVLVATLIVAPQLWNQNRAITSNQLTAPIASDNTIGNAVKKTSAVKTTASNVMLLHIVAADTGQPIPGAAIYSPVTRGTAPLRFVAGTKLATANELGVCEIPPRAQGMSFFSGTDGFVDEQVHWRLDAGEKIPSEYTLRLPRAASIGGLVVDDDGKPVAGAEIQFLNLTRIEPNEGDPEKPGISYLVNVSTAVTDAAGRWHIARFAKEDIAHITFTANHPDFSSEPIMNNMNGLGPEAEKQLLAGTYRYKLTRALSVSGVVVDADGHPVSPARVAFRPSMSALLQMNRGRTRGPAGRGGGMGPLFPSVTTNQADGTFTATGCRPGTNSVIVTAPGFTATTLDVNLTSDSTPLRLVLQPGKVLRLRVLDANGLPPAGAGVRVLSALGTILAVLNCDADGRVAWDRSPDNELPVAIFIRGMTPVTNLVVPANGEEHLVTLAPGASTPSRSRAMPELAASGTVTDAGTHQPIPRFRLITGFATYDTNASWLFGKICYDGKFQSVYGNHSGAAICYKFEAEGYAPFVTRFVRLEEGEVTFNITLQPASSNLITVLMPDGRSAANTDIGLEMPGTPLTLTPAGLWHPRPAQNFNLSKTDGQGRVALPPDDTVVRVIAVNEEGYGEATPAELDAQPTLRLQPWGRVEGDCLVGGKPAAGRTLALENVKTRESLELESTEYTVTTDPNGHFTFAKVPPGQFQLFQTNVTVRSGQTTSVTLDLGEIPLQKPQ